MRNVAAIFSIALLVYLSACDDPMPDLCPNGNEQTKDTLFEYDAVEGSPTYLSIYPECNINISSTSTSGFSVKGESNLVSRFALELEKDTAIFNFSRCTRRYNPLEINAQVEHLQSLTLYDTAFATISNVDVMKKLKLDMYYAAGADIQQGFKELELQHESSGDLTLTDSITTVNINLVGDGNVLAETAHVQKAIITHSGKGDIKIGVFGSLEVQLSGDGNVYYWGDATVKSNVTGTGQVIKM